MYFCTFSNRLSGSSCRGQRNANRFWINLRVSGRLHVSSRLLHGSHGRGDVRRQQSVDSDHPLPGRRSVVRPARRLPQYGRRATCSPNIRYCVLMLYACIYIHSRRVRRSRVLDWNHLKLDHSHVRRRHGVRVRAELRVRGWRAAEVVAL